MIHHKTICVLDNGFYLPIAISLSKYFDKTFYYSHWRWGYPKITTDNIGTGIDGIERINSFWDYLEDIDIFIIPCLGYEDVGDHLRSMGKKVWGGGYSEILEKDRILFRKELESVGLPVVPAEIANGLDELKEKLKGKTNKWLKEASGYRGSWETKHYVSEATQRGFFTSVEDDLGNLNNNIKILIQEPIEAVTEVGTDTYCVNGEMPENVITGIEIKDSGFVGKHDMKETSPKPCIEVNNKFSSVLKKYKHTGCYSTEIRYTKEGISYYTDPTVRFPQPPSFLYIDWITNWGDIIVSGVEGVLVEPVFKYKYGAEIILCSSYVENHNLTVTFPREFLEFVKLKTAYVRDEIWNVVRFKDFGVDMVQFGSAIGMGNTVEEAIDNAMEVAESVECDELSFSSDALEKAKEEISKLEKETNYKF